MTNTINDKKANIPHIPNKRLVASLLLDKEYKPVNPIKDKNETIICNINMPIVFLLYEKTKSKKLKKKPQIYKLIRSTSLTPNMR